MFCAVYAKLDGLRVQLLCTGIVNLFFSLIRTAYVTYGGLGNPIFLSQIGIGAASVVFADDLGFFIC